MKLINKIVISMAAILLVGCASTTIFPEGNNNYSLTTTSSEEGYAEKDAQEKASKQCADMGKKLVVIKHETVYQGTDKSNQAVIGLVSSALGTGGNPAKSDSDYKLTMKFKCV